MFGLLLADRRFVADFAGGRRAGVRAVYVAFFAGDTGVSATKRQETMLHVGRGMARFAGRVQPGIQSFFVTAFAGDILMFFDVGHNFVVNVYAQEGDNFGFYIIWEEVGDGFIGFGRQ